MHNSRGLAAAALCGAVISGAAAQAADDALVARGDYLVNTVMTCGNCHTPKGPQGDIADKAFSGGLEFDEVPFHVWAPNITQDKDTGIGAWSDDDIRNALRHGVRPDGTRLAAVMPVSFYQILTDRDLDAIVAYLRTVPAVSSKVPDPDYKMEFVAQPLPGTEKPISEDERKGDRVREGFYLATIAHCMECHTPRDDRGEPKVDMLGAGGAEIPGPWGVSVSANVTPDIETGIGSWTDDEIRTAITTGIRKDGRPLKPPMGFSYYAKMTPEDLDAIVAWLRTLAPVSHQVSR